MKREIKVGDKLKVVDINGLAAREKLKVGDIVTCTGLTSIDLSTGSKGVYVDGMGFYYRTRFEHVNPVDSLEEQRVAAKALIGKRVKDKDGTILNITKMGIEIDYNPETSLLVNTETSKSGFCVYVVDETFTVPFKTIVEVLPNVIKVQLNASYDAEVSKDSIVVGCQTFPIDILDKLVEARNTLAK